VFSICKELPSCSEYLSACASVAARRIGSSQQHQLEPTEELRLALINTLNHLLDQAVRDRNDSVIAHSMDDLVTAASKAVADAFPDLKKEASNLIQLLASACDEFAESGNSTPHIVINYCCVNKILIHVWLASLCRSSIWLQPRDVFFHYGFSCSTQFGSSAKSCSSSCTSGFSFIPLASAYLTFQS
jgi:hypothetical protein